MFKSVAELIKVETSFSQNLIRKHTYYIWHKLHKDSYQIVIYYIITSEYIHVFLISFLSSCIDRRVSECSFNPSGSMVQPVSYSGC